MAEPDWSVYENFTREEMVCKCGCDKADMDADFMADLQVLRELSNFPFVVTSGFRCVAYNDSIGGGPEHPMGLAVDIQIRNPRAKRVVNLAVTQGWPRIGVSQKRRKARFLHLGRSRDLPEAIWSY